MVCTRLSGLSVAEEISWWLPSALKVQRLVETLPDIREFSALIKTSLGSGNQHRTHFPGRFPLVLVREQLLYVT